MNAPNRKYWFHAKTYGWGWSWPACWQGWLVLLIWLAIVLAGATLATQENLWLFIGFVVVMATVLILICYLTGPPPRWRWGDKDDINEVR